MKKNILTIVISFFLIFATLTLSACDFSIVTPTEKAMAGSVSYESTILQGVKIRTNTQILAVSQSDGTFAFNTTATTLEVYAEKVGYTFSPKKIILTDANGSISFIAKQIKDLDGTLTLKSVQITPTTILSMQNNDYLYMNEGKECLKVNNVIVKLQNNTFNLVNTDTFMEKNATQIFNVSENIQVNTQMQTGITFEFKIEAYYKNVLHVDCLSTQETLSIYKIVSPLNTSLLSDENTVRFEAYGFNSTSQGFTYNMLFIFDYQAN